MSFDSVIFWILFGVIFVMYWRLSKKNQNWLLLGASLFFYSVWDIKFTYLLITSSFIDFHLALAIEGQARESRRKALMWFSVVLNLSLLIFFKYYLVLVNTSATSSWPRFQEIYEWGIPLGISFYTFQVLSYTIDVYRRKVKATNSFADFALFVSFFPQLVAGPIEKARHLLPQIQVERKFNARKVEQGFYLALWGMFKKVYVANGIAFPINNYFDQQGPIEASATLIIFFLMTFQVYADFSGYSDMARGLAHMLGFEITINFKPFWTSRNPSDFWQKWNISLTRWLRDYVFLPLHKRNEADWIAFSKIILIMVIVGLWHAPAVNWFLFGLFNGVVIVAYQVSKKFDFFPKVSGTVLLLLLYFGNGLLHRTPSLELLHRHLMSLLDWTSFAATKDILAYSAWFLLPMILIESFVRFHDPEQECFIRRRLQKIVFCVLCLTGILILERSTQLGFIYFQF